MASQITSLTIVYLSVYSAADQRKHQSSASLAYVWGIHRWPVNSPHKGPVTRKNVSIWWRHHEPIVSCLWLNFQISSFTDDVYRSGSLEPETLVSHDDVIKWKHFPRYWPFVQGIHRSPVNSPHKGQWRGTLMFSLICVWINGWVNNREAGDLRRYRGHYDVIVMRFEGEKSS